MFITILTCVFGCSIALANVPEQSLAVTNRDVGPVTENVPFFVLVQTYTPGSQVTCDYASGAIISVYFVLTSGNMRTTPNTYQIIAGINNKLPSKDKLVKTIKVAKVTIHPLFNGTTMANDLAVLRLTSPLQYNEAVNFISLPKKSASSGYIWKTAVEATSIAYGSRNASLNNLRDCKRTMCIDFLITKNHLCIKQVSILMDMGAPLVKNGEIIGIASFDSYTYTIYTNVFEYVGWIREVMASKQ